jgi:hypothetical protein
MDTRKMLPAFVFIVLMIMPVYVNAAKGSPSETEMCLACHSDKTLTKKLMNKETLSLYINGNEFARSVHAAVGCSGCHPDITLENHPVVKQIRSRKEYAAAMSRQCSVCHTPQQLEKRLPVHDTLAARGTCVECHGSHYIKETAVAKTGMKDNQYCMTCHSRQMSKRLASGELLSVHVNANAIDSSAHKMLKCTECHRDFSLTEHPMRSYANRRTYTVSKSELCGKCHEKAAVQYADSVHLEALNSGNMKAPVCTDCHGFHAVETIEAAVDIGTTSCNKCHLDLNESFQASVHGQARLKGDVTAPTCASCHNAHDVASTMGNTDIQEGCLTCHDSAAKVHSTWLSNPPITLSSFSEAHFKTVSCASCHAEGADRAIYLTVYRSGTDQQLTDEEIMKALGSEQGTLESIIDSDGNGTVGAKEIWNLFTALYKNDITMVLHAEMDVKEASQAHMLGSKAGAVKDCEKCHHPQAPFFEEIFLVVKKADGDYARMATDEGVLNSVYTIIPARKFYAIGSISIQLFDILFVVALIGGLAVPIGHISLRLITSPLRSIRKMGKGGKK